MLSQINNYIKTPFVSILLLIFIVIFIYCILYIFIYNNESFNNETDIISQAYLDAQQLEKIKILEDTILNLQVQLKLITNDINDLNSNLGIQKNNVISNLTNNYMENYKINLNQANAKSYNTYMKYKDI